MYPTPIVIFVKYEQKRFSNSFFAASASYLILQTAPSVSHSWPEGVLHAPNRLHRIPPSRHPHERPRAGVASPFAGAGCRGRRSSWVCRSEQHQVSSPRRICSRAPTRLRTVFNAAQILLPAPLPGRRRATAATVRRREAGSAPPPRSSPTTRGSALGAASSRRFCPSTATKSQEKFLVYFSPRDYTHTQDNSGRVSQARITPQGLFISVMPASDNDPYSGENP